MKRLMFMISIEGKNPKQISEDAIKAFNKYKETENDVLNSNQEGKQKPQKTE